MGRFEEAGEAYTEALQLRRALAESNPDAYNPNLAGTLNNLSNLHLNMGRFEEAEKAYTEALRLYRALAKKYPDAYNPSLKGVENNIEKLEQLKKQQEAA
jgi:tetratricopeptide (TPR) repeat protein